MSPCSSRRSSSSASRSRRGWVRGDPEGRRGTDSRSGCSPPRQADSNRSQAVIDLLKLGDGQSAVERQPEMHLRFLRPDGPDQLKLAVHRPRRDLQRPGDLFRRQPLQLLECDHPERLVVQPGTACRAGRQTPRRRRAWARGQGMRPRLLPATRLPRHRRLTQHVTAAPLLAGLMPNRADRLADRDREQHPPEVVPIGQPGKLALAGPVAEALKRARAPRLLRRWRGARGREAASRPAGPTA